MVVFTLIVAFIFFLMIGVPIAFVLGLTPLVAMMTQGETPLILAAQRIFTGIDSPILMAVPFFILAGNIMSAGGMTARLLGFCNILVGWLRGGLAYINVVISMFFAGITGAAVADTSAVGSILIPAMKKEGYDIDFAAAVTATSSTIGPVIPPSIPFIIYGVLGEVSIASLFLAGIVPGVLLGLFQMGVVGYYSHKHQYPKGSLPSLRTSIKVSIDAALVLMLPVIILGGILTGYFYAHRKRLYRRVLCPFSKSGRLPGYRYPQVAPHSDRHRCDQLAGDDGHRHGQHFFMAFGVGRNSSNGYRTDNESHHQQGVDSAFAERGPADHRHVHGNHRITDYSDPGFTALNEADRG